MRVSSLISLAEELKIKYSENESMALHTSFKIGGKADIYLKPETAEQLTRLITFLGENEIPFFVLGSGSNLIVSDKGIEGAVVDTTALNKIYLKDDNCIYAEAGASLAALCCFARDNSLTGLEFAYGIPGSVGGALYMNAGAYGGDMSCVVTSADSITVKGQKVSRCAEQLELGYRKSVFKKNGEIIVGVCFKLNKSSREEIGSKMDEIIAKRKNSQPLEYPSAGSTFKRPEGYYAAALIDECELKGRAVGGAKVSEKHAGFVINFDKATCEDVIGLVEVIKDTVKEKKGVDLETEIIFVGRQ